MHETFTKLGAIQSVEFKGVGPGGADIYEVNYEHGKAQHRLIVTPEGKITWAVFRPEP